VPEAVDVSRALTWDGAKNLPVASTLKIGPGSWTTEYTYDDGDQLKSITGGMWGTGGVSVDYNTEAATKKIVGWSMRDDLKADIVVDALSMATILRRPAAGLIHHSDRGAQYRSMAFGRTLRESGILASMGSVGAPGDDAVTESVMATIKKECVHRHTFRTRDAARFALFRYIEGFYNTYRRHSSIGDLSPTEFERRLEERRLQAIAS
jgi:transposase InsO family protein